MTLQEITNAVQSGKIVHWSSVAYRVVEGTGPTKGQFYIWCTGNDNYTGLTWADGITLNGEPSEFWIHHKSAWSEACDAYNRGCVAGVQSRRESEADK